MTMSAAALRLKGSPERVFVSVDESTGKSTISFAPADCGPPVQHDDDKTGSIAMAEARSISSKYPGCTVHGPHFHTARPPNARWKRRRPAGTKSEGAEGADSDDE
jgi:hypothetical protein